MFLHGICFSSCLKLLKGAFPSQQTISCNWSKPFPPQVSVGHGVYYNYRKLTRTTGLPSATSDKGSSQQVCCIRQPLPIKSYIQTLSFINYNCYVSQTLRDLRGGRTLGLQAKTAHLKVPENRRDSVCGGGVLRSTPRSPLPVSITCFHHSLTFWPCLSISGLAHWWGQSSQGVFIT